MTRTAHPYETLPATRFWKSGVAEVTPFSIEGIYERKFQISRTDRVATAGSCFAQHVARNMKARGFHIVDVEPPLPGMTEKTAQKFGYNIYSARYANIYTTRQLRQLVDDALALQAAPEGAALDHILRDEDVMERNGRHYDALRPNVEPEGLASVQEVKTARKAHLERVYEMLTGMDVLVFTFGLTETWRNTRTGTVYPVCPGVIAGDYDPELHAFHNMTHAECLEDFVHVRAALRDLNPDLRFVVTVSPVPLTATAAPMHVLSATTYSKSVLRAVCGEIAATCPDVDYFPSYELITAPFSRGAFFEANMRSVTEEGVGNVMRLFFEAHDPDAKTAARPGPARSDTARADTPAEPATDRQRQRAAARAERQAARAATRQAERLARRQAGRGVADRTAEQAADDLVCEEALLDAFRK